MLWGWMLLDLSTQAVCWKGTVLMGDVWCLSHPSIWETYNLRLSLASLFMNQNSRTAWNSWGEQDLEGVRGQRKWCDLSHLCCVFAEQRQEGAAG